MPQITPKTVEEIDCIDIQPLVSYNNSVCATWKTLKDTPDAKVFEKCLFDRIALVISNETGHLKPHEHLNMEEKEYLPIFERLVNIKRVKENLALSRHPNHTAKYQEKGIQAIENIHSLVISDYCLCSLY